MYRFISYAILLCAAVTACATPHDMPVYSDYLAQCRRGNSENAGTFVRDPAAEPCPAVTADLDPDAHFDRIADVGGYSLLNDGTGWKLDAHRMLDSSSLDATLTHIQYAIQHRDAQKLYDLLGPAMQQQYTVESLAHDIDASPEWNAIYAALAAAAPDDTYCTQQSVRAQCLIAGTRLVFAVHQNHWRIESYAVE